MGTRRTRQLFASTAGDRPITPTVAAGIYLLFGLVALYGSDVLLVRLFDPASLRRLQLVKGVLEVVLTAGLILLLTSRSREPLKRALAQRDEHLQELSVLHRVFRHNFRNDLNLVQGYGEMLAGEDADGETYERFEAALEDITHLVDDVVFIGELPSSTDPDTSVDLVPALRRVVADLRSEYGVEASLESPPSVAASAVPQIGRAFREVLTNAVEHHDREAPTVSVSVAEDDAVTVRVVDDGPGVPEPIRRRLGEQTSPDLDHLDGLGLWIAYWTTVRSGGTLTIADNDPRGTVVVFRLPRPPRHA